ncbi:hypothetical protein CDAR_506691 [Caerostris darwini]|uniref:Uncharacterized protein n=1 Tax=Caerostris darwini TaxID=1538125 RepID=A0AAV4P247_9ARAC|nr:hypothetical protein CDAR_506691 [Caerostris darwini]
MLKEPDPSNTENLSQRAFRGRNGPGTRDACGAIRASSRQGLLSCDWRRGVAYRLSPIPLAKNFGMSLSRLDRSGRMSCSFSGRLSGESMSGIPDDV